MMRVDKIKLADALDKAADYFDSLEASKVAGARAERQAVVDKIAAQYAESTGEELPQSVRDKLAQSEGDVVAWLEQLTAKHAGKIEELGGPSSRRDNVVPQTVKEAADAAYERFGDWLANG